jgi:hypothetical protein
MNLSKIISFCPINVLEILVNSGLYSFEMVLKVSKTPPIKIFVECSCALVSLHVLNLLEQALPKTPVTGLFPGKAGIGPVTEADN